MDKEVLKSVMASLKGGEQLEVNFLGDFQSLSGAYTVTKVSKGKGKGGSLIMSLVSVSTGNVLDSLTFSDGKPHFIGTPTSEYILNVTVGGVMHGVANASELPKAFPRSKEAGNALRDALKPLVGKTTPTVLKIESEAAPEFTGTWNVKEAKVNAGRHGQVSLMLEDVSNPSNVRELWSYRHGGVIDSLEIVGEDSAVATETPTE